MKFRANIVESVDDYRPQELDYWPTDKLVHIRRQDKRFCPESKCDPESKNDCTFYTYSDAKDILITVAPLEENEVAVTNRTIRWGKVYRTLHREHPSYRFARTATIKKDDEYQSSPGEQDWKDTYLPRKEDEVGFSGEYYHGFVLSTFEDGDCVGGSPIPDRPVCTVPLSTDKRFTGVRAVIAPQRYASYDLHKKSTDFYDDYFDQFLDYGSNKPSILKRTSKKYPYRGPVGNWQELRRGVLIRIINGIAKQRSPVPKAAIARTVPDRVKSVPRTSVENTGVNRQVALAKAIVKRSPVATVETVRNAPVKRSVVDELKRRHDKKPKLSEEKIRLRIKGNVIKRSPVQEDTEDERKPAARKL
jgi:hypothetical protein